MTSTHYANVVDGVWVGDMDAAVDVEFLGEADITYIVNLSGFEDPQVEDVDYYNVVIYDQEQLEQEIERTRNKVKNAADAVASARAKKKNVLVHCKNGINCAPTVIGYFLVNELKMSPEAALELLRDANKKREIPAPYAMSNQSFRRSLLGVREQPNRLW